ncbi:hypothetical protein QEZ52_17165 [Aliisedimentitalea scapharcae]|uniref:TIGR02391 family protein n=1 Tax=Aliisedimentitalea scapharcae TaxID=1524259 RepID=A0ABZ2XSE0_9RHOB
MIERPNFRDTKKAATVLDNWLGDRQYGYRDLNPQIKATLMYFSIVWSIFEFQALDNNASPESITSFVNEKVPADYDFTAFEEAFAYYTQRYVEEGKIKGERFNALVGGSQKMQPNKETVAGIRSALLGSISTPQGKLIGLLLVVYRLRNNAFHGVKWKRGVDDQHDNFEQAICVLINAMDAFVPKKEAR